MRLKLMLPAVLLLAMLGACAHSLPSTLTPIDAIERVDVAAWPKADAVLLRDARVYAFNDNGNAESTDERRHRIVQVLRPDGRWAGNAVIPIDDDQTIESFAARTITPDGRVLPVRRSQTFMASGTDTDGDATRRTLRFAFPEADVGSLLEYSVVLRSDGISLSIVHVLDDKMPVKHAYLRFSGTNRVHPEVHAYNLDATPTGGGADGRWWIESEAFNVPARSRERLSAHWSWRVPYVIFRQTGRVRAYGLQALNSTWDGAGWYLGKRIAVDWGSLPDNTVTPGKCGEADVLCRIGVGWAAVQAKVRPIDNQYLWGDPLATVVKNGAGNHAQRAVYLWRALEQLGIDAKPAAIVQRHGFNLNWTRPSTRHLDHLLVYVPAQPGLDAPMWLDPACFWCQPGQLAHQSRKTQALILDFDTLANRISTSRKTVAGDAGPLASWHARVDGTLSAQGELTGTWRSVEGGSRIAKWLQADPTPTPKADKYRLDRFVVDIAGEEATAQVIENGCGAARQTCAYAFHFKAPAYATVQGERLIVPLSVFSKHRWMDAFAAPKRTTALRLRKPTSYHDTVRITLPAGYRVLNAPPPISVQSSLGTMAFKVWQDADTLVIERRLMTKDGLRAAADFDKIKAPFDFYRRLRDAVVLVGPTATP